MEIASLSSQRRSKATYKQSFVGSSSGITLDMLLLLPFKLCIVLRTDEGLLKSVQIEDLKHCPFAEVFDTLLIHYC